MENSFYIRSSSINDYCTLDEIKEINDIVSTKKPLFEVRDGIGDIAGAQILIDVGIGLISAIAYDLLKYAFFKLKDVILKKHIKEDFGNPSPDINIIVDAKEVNVSYTVTINCEASEDEVEACLKEMKNIANAIIENNSETTFDECS